jgi:hypothetical protein
MRTIVIAALLVGFAVPAVGAECAYVSGFDQGRFIETGPTTGTFVDGAGYETPCTIQWNEENGNVMACEGMPEAQFSLMPNTLVGDELNLLILHDHAWYLTCAE